LRSLPYLMYVTFHIEKFSFSLCRALAQKTR